MTVIPKSIQRLIDQLNQLPGIGPKTASRLVFYLVRNQNTDVGELGEAFTLLREDLIYCGQCHNIADQDPCQICADKSRDESSICVVEEPLDVIALERAGHKGLYHVLGGRIAPLDGIGPKDLNIESLVDRIKVNFNIKELILATNANVEGEATAAYLVKVLNSLDIKITRIARGLPVGGDLEYADELTLSRALEGRGLVTSETRE